MRGRRAAVAGVVAAVGIVPVAIVAGGVSMAEGPRPAAVKLAPAAAASSGSLGPAASGNVSPTSTSVTPTSTPAAFSGTAQIEAAGVAGSAGVAAGAAAGMDARMARLSSEVSPLVQPYDIGVMIRDNRSGRTWTYRGDKSENMASLTKLSTSVALFLTADRAGRAVTDQERRWMRQALQVSDNDAQSALWKRIGGANGYDAAMRRLGLENTHAARGYGWGRTFSTPRDQVTLMTMLQDAQQGKAGPLAAKDAEWLLTTMRGVSSEQVWGSAPFGKATGRVVEVKNGWSPYSDTGRWRLTSLGHIKDSRHDYTIAILSDGWRSMGAGTPKLNAIGTAVYQILGY